MSAVAATHRATVMECGHEADFGEFPPEAGEIVLCSRCDEYRAVSLPGAASTPRLSGSEKAPSPHRIDHLDCDHPRTSAGYQRCRKHWGCDHPQTDAARYECSERRHSEGVSLGHARHGYMSHLKCDHPKTKNASMACLNSERRHQDCDHPNTPEARGECKTRWIAEKPQYHRRCGHPDTAEARAACFAAKRADARKGVGDHVDAQA